MMQSTALAVIIKKTLPPPTYYIAGTTTGKVFRRTLAGSWSQVYSGVTANGFRWIDRSIDMVFAATSIGVMYSSNLGLTWQMTNHTVNSMCVLFFNDVYYVGTFSDGIYKSTDGLNYTKMGTLGWRCRKKMGRKTNWSNTK